MGLSSVKEFFARAAPDIEVMQLPDEIVLLVTRGDARLDNRKYKERFGAKARMLEAAAVEAQTGHPLGGVCPFGLRHAMRVFCDISLRAFDTVLPAGGTPDSVVRISPERMAQLTGAEWVDVTVDHGSASQIGVANRGLLIAQQGTFLFA